MADILEPGSIQVAATVPAPELGLTIKPGSVSVSVAVPAPAIVPDELPFYETFEADEFDDALWSKTGNGQGTPPNTVSGNSAGPGGTLPGGLGDECLIIDKQNMTFAAQCSIYNSDTGMGFLQEYGTVYGRFYCYLDHTSLTDTQSGRLFTLFPYNLSSNALVDFVWLAGPSGIKIRGRLRNTNTPSQVTITSDYIDLQTWYRVEFYWNPTAKECEWKLAEGHGTAVSQGTSSGWSEEITGRWCRLSIGSYNTQPGTGDHQFYIDEIEMNETGWAGPVLCLEPGVVGAVATVPAPELGLTIKPESIPVSASLPAPALHLTIKPGSIAVTAALPEPGLEVEPLLGFIEPFAFVVPAIVNAPDLAFTIKPLYIPVSAVVNGPRTYPPDDAHVWGEESPDPGEIPAQWTAWSDGAGGSPAITGGGWGLLSLGTGDIAHSPVKYMGESSSYTITVTENKYGSGTGNFTVYIRGSNTVFTQDAGAPSWEEYTAPALKTWTFMQLKLEGG